MSFLSTLAKVTSGLMDSAAFRSSSARQRVERQLGDKANRPDVRARLNEQVNMEQRWKARASDLSDYAKRKKEEESEANTPTNVYHERVASEPSAEKKYRADFDMLVSVQDSFSDDCNHPPEFRAQLMARSLSEKNYPASLKREFLSKYLDTLDIDAETKEATLSRL